MTTFFLITFGFAGIVVGWVVIDYLRRILDALHTLILQGTRRRGWERKPIAHCDPKVKN